MNTYEKLTVASFTAKLKDDAYKNLAGARRAIGKAQDMSIADKNQARAAAEKYFNGSSTLSSTPAAKAAKPKAPVKKATEAKPKAALARAAARRAGPAPAKPKATRGRPKGRPTTETPIQAEAAPEKASRPQAALALADQAIATVGKALTAIKECQVIYPSADTSAVQHAVDALLGTIEFVTTAVTPSLPKSAAAAVLPNPNGLARADVTEAPQVTS